MCIRDRIYTLVEPTAENYRQAAAVVRQYDDAREYDYTRIDFVDAIPVSYTHLPLRARRCPYRAYRPI